MKKQQNNSTRAWALQVALSVALVSISAVLVASSFKATPATRGLSAPIQPAVAGNNDLMIAGPASARTLSPADAPFTFSDTGSLNIPRFRHTATLLPNGKVLVAGGDNGSGELSSAELYDPTSGTWTPTGSLNTARESHTATLLPNGKVLVAGGQGPAALLEARNCTTLPAGRGATRAISPHTVTTRRRCCLTARCWWQGEMVTAALLKRGTVRPCQRDVDSHQQTEQRTLLPHSDVAAQRQGAGGRGTEWRQRSYQRGTVRPCQRDVDSHRQLEQRTRLTHGDVAA